VVSGEPIDEATQTAEFRLDVAPREHNEDGRPISFERVCKLNAVGTPAKLNVLFQDAPSNTLPARRCSRRC
jgi:hypothetical protein